MPSLSIPLTTHWRTSFTGTKKRKKKTKQTRTRIWRVDENSNSGSSLTRNFRALLENLNLLQFSVSFFILKFSCTLGNFRVLSNLSRIKVEWESMEDQFLPFAWLVIFMHLETHARSPRVWICSVLNQNGYKLQFSPPLFCLKLSCPLEQLRMC